MADAVQSFSVFRLAIWTITCTPSRRTFRRIAQLVERPLYTGDVAGLTPAPPTKLPIQRDVQGLTFCYRRSAKRTRALEVRKDRWNRNVKNRRPKSPSPNAAPHSV